MWKVSLKLQINTFSVQSLGGLLATEILLKNPEMFDNYFIISPSLWWDDESLLNQAGTLLSKSPDTKKFVYVSVGKGRTSGDGKRC